jgi:hypothetical protein
MELPEERRKKTDATKADLRRKSFIIEYLSRNFKTLREPVKKYGIACAP